MSYKTASGNRCCNKYECDDTDYINFVTKPQAVIAVATLNDFEESDEVHPLQNRKR